MDVYPELPMKRMNTITALRLDRDRDLSADIVPEAYFRCQAIRELSFPWATNAFERQFTEARLAWTDKYLYIHLWAKDSWIVVGEDSLEVFLQPEDGRYWGWQANASGVGSGFLVADWGLGPVEKRHIESRPKTQTQWKTRRHDAGWVLELKIPFAKDLGRVPRRGETWRVTFNRTDVDRQGRATLSTFSDLSPDDLGWFHQPQGFGQLVFG